MKLFGKNSRENVKLHFFNDENFIIFMNYLFYRLSKKEKKM